MNYLYKEEKLRAIGKCIIKFCAYHKSYLNDYHREKLNLVQQLVLNLVLNLVAA